MDVLAAVFGTLSRRDTTNSQTHNKRVKPVSNSQVKSFEKGNQEEADFLA